MYGRVHILAYRCNEGSGMNTKQIIVLMFVFMVLICVSIVSSLYFYEMKIIDELQDHHFSAKGRFFIS